MQTLVSARFSTRFVDEIVAAVTRVNYAQSPITMSALAGVVSLAGVGPGLWAVSNGNDMVVHELFRNSGINVRVNTTVMQIARGRGQQGRYVLSLREKRDDVEDEVTMESCDAVVLAAPYEVANVSVPEDLRVRLDVQREFQTLHVSFVRGAVSTRTFGRDPPREILTTMQATSAGFLSLTPAAAGLDSVWKVFSHKALDTEMIGRLFEDGAEMVRSFVWKAYPRYDAPERFGEYDVDESEGGALFYSAALESAGSAMEMSAVAGMNVAGLVRDRLGLGGEMKASEKDEL